MYVCMYCACCRALRGPVGNGVQHGNQPQCCYGTCHWNHRHICSLCFLGRYAHTGGVMYVCMVGIHPPCLGGCGCLGGDPPMSQCGCLGGDLPMSQCGCLGGDPPPPPMSQCGCLGGDLPMSQCGCLGGYLPHVTVWLPWK